MKHKVTTELTTHKSQVTNSQTHLTQRPVKNTANGHKAMLIKHSPFIVILIKININKNRPLNQRLLWYGLPISPHHRDFDPSLHQNAFPSGFVIDPIAFIGVSISREHFAESIAKTIFVMTFEVFAIGPSILT